MATSRSPVGLPSSARSAAARTSSAASSVRSTDGSVRRDRGDPRLAPTSVGMRPVRASHAVNTRAAVARRARVVRESPLVCCLASQLRSDRRSSSPMSGDAQPGGVVEQAGDVAEVGAHGVRGQVPLGDQVPLVVGQQARHRLGQAARLVDCRAGHAAQVRSREPSSPGCRASRQPRPAAATSARPTSSASAACVWSSRTPAVREIESAGAGRTAGTASSTWRCRGGSRSAARTGPRQLERQVLPCLADHLQHVVAPGHHRRLPAAEQPVDALGRCAGDRTRDAHERPVQARRPGRGVERTAAAGRLHDHRPAGQRGDHPVAGQEPRLERCVPGRGLRDHGAVLGDVLDDLAVRLRGRPGRPRRPAPRRSSLRPRGHRGARRRRCRTLLRTRPPSRCRAAAEAISAATSAP